MGLNFALAYPRSDALAHDLASPLAHYSLSGQGQNPLKVFKFELHFLSDLAKKGGFIPFFYPGGATGKSKQFCVIYNKITNTAYSKTFGNLLLALASLDSSSIATKIIGRTLFCKSVLVDFLTSSLLLPAQK